MPIIAQQQGSAAPWGQREAYERGQKVGQCTIYAIIVAIVVWGIAKLFKGRPKR